MSIGMQCKATSKATPDKNKPKLHSLIKIKQGFKSHAQISQGTQIYFMYN